MRNLIFAIAVAAAAACAGWSKTKEKAAPSWVTETATRATPVYSGRVPAAVLLNEQKVTIDALGTMNTVTRKAVKILTHEGKQEAEAVVAYEKGGDQVKDLRAWLVAPSGYVKTFEKADVEDLGVYSDDLYNDFRVRRIRAINPELGSVFVYESEVLQKPTEAQDRFMFQDNLPAIESRYTITAPAGWAISGRLLNHAPVEAVVDGNTYTWVLKDLSFREREPFAPRLYGTGALLAVDFQPPASIADLPSLKSWTDVSDWHTRIAAPQAEVNAEMEGKVRELTQGLSSEYDKIRAIGHFVQKFRYVEIAMDLSHHGGVRPHAAAQVFAKQYGDCKDKANLMRALLKSAGIPSYLVVIYSGDRTFVKKEWASPSQFNHMIIAVQVGESVKGPTVIDSPVGRVLLFDPTDEKTPVGDFPLHEQGSYALLCAGMKGELVRMPVIAPEENVLAQTVAVSLGGDGGITGSLTFKSTGQSARHERGLYEGGSPDEYRSAMERYLSTSAKGAAVAKVTTQDLFNENKFSAELNFASEHYGQLMQNRMLVFNPAITEPAANRFPTVKERLEPILLNGKIYRKHVTVKLPSGFTVEEMPGAFTDKTAFGQFSITYRQEAGQLIVDEELRVETVTLPAAEYAQVKKFFDNALGADAQNVVLVKN